jgi:hypothetical protein
MQRLGYVVDEDFMLLLPAQDDDGYVLGAYLTCFASGFEIGNILGKRLRELHGEVPDYREKLQSPMERWFKQLPTGKLFRRHNVCLVPHRPTNSVVSTDGMPVDCDVGRKAKK